MPEEIEASEIREVRYVYDEQQRIVKQTEAHNGHLTHSITYEYNDAGAIVYQKEEYYDIPKEEKD